MAGKNGKPNHVGGRIVIMDSDQEAVKQLTVALGKEGHKIESIVQIGRLFEKIKNEQIDVLILAVEVWGIKGYELIPTIKEMNSLLPIIVTSADDSVEVATRVREHGIFFYAIKPLDMKEIKLALKNALRRRFISNFSRYTGNCKKEKD